ncbi:hypothetical protein M2G23_10795 [Vibrio vulnificus]|nr:hypothetical protein [Vibrio vulnificus]MCU8111722.1 hypothetical protein [Vibrio vulnificus]MCU8221205.1 hypothetical protein [Vibrio vulnificus]MCU8225550.1 hypothetical protein [Vibrio vulnificus]MCU8238705.1 hypothetical protein [Vibrio vulnificus]
MIFVVKMVCGKLV